MPQMVDTGVVDAPTVILVGSISGGIGAWIRIVVRDECIARGVASWKAILSINLVGSGLAGAALRLPTDPLSLAAISLGFLGGFTTFSSMCLDAVVQWVGLRRRASALIVAATMLGGPVIAAIATSVVAVATVATATIPLVGEPRAGRRRMVHHFSGVTFISIGACLGSGIRVSMHLLAPIVGLPVWTATAVVNAVGAGFAGFVFRWLCALDIAGAPRHSPNRRLVTERLLIFGFAGGLTTMSALSVEMLVATRESWWLGASIGAINIALRLPATILGWWIASRLFPSRECFITQDEARVLSS